MGPEGRAGGAGFEKLGSLGTPFANIPIHRKGFRIQKSSEAVYTLVQE